MKEKVSSISRRNFFKTLGALGVGAMAAPLEVRAADKTIAKNSNPSVVPQRPFGKTGHNVSILSLGGMFDTRNNQILLRQAVKWGVTYWDTATYYNSWGSEEGFGKYLAKYPQDRKKIFLVSKSPSKKVSKMTQYLDDSLKFLKTDYLDLYFVHAVNYVEDELNDDTRKWAEKTKKDGKIKLFGFSTHSNMADNLFRASKLDWIDGIMTTYNFRVMHELKMKTAIEACYKAGIGLTAMKTQASTTQVDTGQETDASKQLIARSIKKGFTEEQARLVAVWKDQRIASICSQMPSMTLLKANVEAATNGDLLSKTDTELLQEHSKSTAHSYCAGCKSICEMTIHNQAPIGDVMRYLMYVRAYKESRWAKEEFERIPDAVREKMARIDYTEAEKACPNRLAIGKLMRTSLIELA